MHHRRLLRFATNSLFPPFAYVAPREDPGAAKDSPMAPPRGCRSPASSERDLDQRRHERHAGASRVTRRTMTISFYSIFTTAYLLHARNAGSHGCDGEHACRATRGEMRSGRVQHHSRFHSHSGADRDATTSSVPAPTLSDLRIEARAHRSSFPPRRATRATRTIEGCNGGCLSAACDRLFSLRGPGEN